MNKIIKIEDNIEKRIQLKIKYRNNKIFKESFFASQENTKMKTFFKTNFDLLQKEIQDDNYVIYFLINDIENQIYIGKSKNFSARLQNHYLNKLFNRIIVLCSNNWTSSIIDYLEYWFIDFFSKNNEFKLKNCRIEKEPNINLMDEEIIIDALSIFKWLLLTEGFNIDCYFKNQKETQIIEKENNDFFQNNNENPRDVYFKKVKAHYFENEIRSQKLLLFQNTKIIWNKFSYESFPGSVTSIKAYNEWFEDNIKQNNIKQISLNEYVLNKNIKTSASFGACLICGYFSQNGNAVWKTLDGISIKELKNKK